MRISKLSSAALGLLLCTPAFLNADVATFTTEDGKLTGKLRAIGKDGIIEWTSPFSQEALKLRSDQLNQVEFESNETSPPIAPIQLTLRNGDILPTTQVSAMNKDDLVAKTGIAGTITIPRPALASAQFGITERKVIYSGFDNLRQWTQGKGEPDHWKLRGKSLVSSGSSIAAREFKVPRNFRMEFTLEWESRSPNYNITFADPLVKGSLKENLYRFDFDNAGIRISRHIEGQTRLRTLAQWQRRPSQFTDNKFEVKIEVDRDNRKLELFIDGESEGVITDPLETIPSASGFSFGCQTHSGGKQTIRDFTLSELNDNRTRHLAEKRGDPSLDCLITADDDRWSGQLLSLAGTPKERLMVFKTSFAKESWEVPENEISTLFFANNPFKGGPGGEPAFLIQFHGKGKLSAISCVISDDQVEVSHPLLGPLKIDRASIKAMRRVSK